MTRKQFVLALTSALVGTLGISTFMGLFTKGIAKQDERPGYGVQNYGP